jgi:hypothetical protein
MRQKSPEFPVRVGTCWTGYNAVIVVMDNGDNLYLGDITQDIVKARYAMALLAQTTQQAIFYQVTTSATICGETRGSPDWWIDGGSVY